jgi:hypothetical protein
VIRHRFVPKLANIGLALKSHTKNPGHVLPELDNFVTLLLSCTRSKCDFGYIAKKLGAFTYFLSVRALPTTSATTREVLRSRWP